MEWNNFFWLITPSLLTLSGAIAALTIPLLFSRRAAGTALIIGGMTLTGALITAWNLWQHGEGTIFQQILSLDRLKLWTDLVLAIGGLLTLGLMAHAEGRKGLPAVELVSLVLFSTFGMMVVAMSRDLFLAFLGVEILSLATYTLAGLNRSSPFSNEAALKYFTLGAFASSFLLFGTALYYGVFGTTSLEIATALDARFLLPFRLSLALLLVGIAFKGAWVPFHFWAPDVYQGAPTTVTVFMAGPIKVAAFILAVRILNALQPLGDPTLTTTLAIFAALTILAGNLGALFQRNIKRLLAWSAVAHAGYALIGLAVGDNPSLLFYLTSYLFMTIGSFGVVVAMNLSGEGASDLEDFAGLSQRHPALAAVMAIFMFSLTGLPPTIGFTGKFYLFQSAIEKGFLWLALVGIAGSLISVAYYFRVVWVMYFGDKEASYQPPPIPYNVTAVLAVTGFSVLYLGIFPGPLIALARQTLGIP